MRRLLVSPFAVLALALALPATATAAPLRCGALKGKTVLQDKRIKVVAKKVRDKRLAGTRILGCALPNGRVRLVGERGTPRGNRYENAADYQIYSHAGTYLDLGRVFGDGDAQTAQDARFVLDLRSGRRTFYYNGSFGEGSCAGTADPASPTTPPVQRVVLRANGLFAVLYAAPAGTNPQCYPNDGQALLKGFVYAGDITLDLAPVADIPADSVTIAGEEFRWTHAGEARTEQGS